MKNDFGTQTTKQTSKQGKTKSKTGLIIAIIVLVILILGAISIGAMYWLYKISLGDKTGVNTHTTSSPTATTTGCSSCNSKTDTSTWQTYNNSRYGFSIKAPADFDKFESQNGDGATFSHPDAVAIKAYGSNNSESLTLSQYLDREYSQLQMETPDVKVTGINEINLNGCEGERRVWEYTNSVDKVKSIYEKAVCLQDNVFYVMEMVVAESSYSKYSSIFDNVIFSFKFK